jgi:hypothetical protein
VAFKDEGTGCFLGCFLVFVIVGCAVSAFNMHGDGEKVPQAIYIVGISAVVLLVLLLLKAKSD